MTSEEPSPEEEDEEAPFLHRLEMIKDLIEAPDEVIEALYDGYGKSMLYTAGGAAGAAAGVAVGGPVGLSLIRISEPTRLLSISVAVFSL